MNKPPVLPAPPLSRSFLCKQALEISDTAREHRDFESALAALDFIAQLQGMYDNPLL